MPGPLTFSDRHATIVTYSTDRACGRGEALAERLQAFGYTDVLTYREGSGGLGWRRSPSGDGA